MAAVRLLRPTTLFTPDQWAAMTRVSAWRGLWLVAHAWGVVALALGLATWWGNPFGWLVAVIVVGGRQLGLAILMHEAAHGALHPNRRINNAVGQWLTGAAVGSDLIAYRTYHLAHHKYVQQAEDPDLPLSAPFPASGASLRRKVLRDLSGATFFKQRRAQFGMALAGLRAMLAGRSGAARGTATVAGTTFNRATPRTGIAAPARDAAGAIVVAHSVGRFLLVQAGVLAISLATVGWTPFLLWIAALATTFQLFLRIRNIAEHACTATGSDNPFSHARTTRANWLERATVAPYWVNYHCEHHLFMGLPCYRLAAAHRILGAGGHHDRMTLAPGYRAVLRQVTASPNA